METNDCDQMHEDLFRRANMNNRHNVQTQLSLLFHAEEYWRNRRPPDVSPKKFEFFLQYVEHPGPWGLDWKRQILQGFLLPERNNLWQKIEAQIPAVNVHGTNQHNEDVTCNVLIRGNSRPYQLGVLKRDVPEIAEKVIAGEITANEGMVLAGKKSPTVTCKATVQGFYDAIQRKLDPEQINLLRAML